MLADRRLWPAPAKLNLFLRVAGRRPDGYHALQTVFQFLDHADELAFRVTGDGRIARTREVHGVPAESDLTLRAARLLQRACGGTAGVEVTLTKRLPVGGGLGGGSSDAATTLIALNRIWKAGLSVSQLAALGLELGADVPVFIHGRAAWAEGVGEVLSTVELPEPWYVVIIPPAPVSTAAVFAELDRESRLTPLTPPRTIRDLHAGHGGNDLEAIVRRQYPAVEQAFQYLGAHATPRMTGTGGCVFAEAADPWHGERILAGLPQGFTGFVARAMNRHPLLEEA